MYISTPSKLSNQVKILHFRVIQSDNIPLGGRFTVGDGDGGGGGGEGGLVRWCLSD